MKLTLRPEISPFIQNRRANWKSRREKIKPSVEGRRELVMSRIVDGIGDMSDKESFVIWFLEIPLRTTVYTTRRWVYLCYKERTWFFYVRRKVHIKTRLVIWMNCCIHCVISLQKIVSFMQLICHIFEKKFGMIILTFFHRVYECLPTAVIIEYRMPIYLLLQQDTYFELQC